MEEEKIEIHGRELTREEREHTKIAAALLRRRHFTVLDIGERDK